MNYKAWGVDILYPVVPGEIYQVGVLLLCRKGVVINLILEIPKGYDLDILMRTCDSLVRNGADFDTLVVRKEGKQWINIPTRLLLSHVLNAQNLILCR